MGLSYIITKHLPAPQGPLICSLHRLGSMDAETKSVGLHTGGMVQVEVLHGVYLM